MLLILCALAESESQHQKSDFFLHLAKISDTFLLMAIYFVRAGENGPVKIGFSSRNVLARVGAMQVGSPFPMILMAIIDGDRGAEKELQEKFKAHHLRGEWFMPGGEFGEFLASLPPPAEGFVSIDILRSARKLKERNGKKGRKRRLSDERMKEIRDILVNTDMPIIRVAKKFGIAPTTIHYHFPRLDKLRKFLPRTGRPCRLTTEQLAEMEKLLLTRPTMTIKKIGKLFRVSSSTVNNHFPRWRSKTKRERIEYRRENPLPAWDQKS